MFDVGDGLAAPLAAAQRRLELDAAAAAKAQTAIGSPLSDAAMARVAQGALFSEVLLNAMHARFAEIKTAAK